MDRRDAKIIRDALLAIVSVLDRTYQLGRRDPERSVSYNDRNQPEETPALSRR